MQTAMDRRINCSNGMVGTKWTLDFVCGVAVTVAKVRALLEWMATIFWNQKVGTMLTLASEYCKKW